MSLDNPKVSVIMPVYNGEQYLNEAIESILNQSFRDYEFLIVDDCSTDSSFQIIASYKDSRIRLLRNDKNMGLVASLNKGIKFAKGDYIARMDCDDVSLPDRLEKEVAILDMFSEVGVCSTWGKFIDKKGIEVGELRTRVGNRLYKNFWKPSPIIHAACMIRSQIIKENRFDPMFEHAEDYELWLRLFNKTKFFNINEFKYLIRLHDKRVTVQDRCTQLRNSYNAFCIFLGHEQIPYEGFLSLLFESKKVGVLERTHYYRVASKKTGLDIPELFIDSLRYWSSRHPDNILKKLKTVVIRKKY